MIRYIYADKLKGHPNLAESMFIDRAYQFKKRLNWKVQINEDGWEIDEYDALNPLYIVYVDPEGRHAGSVRVMPTTGRIMTNDHFLDLTDGVRISSPFIWECTRFCLAKDAGAGVAAALLGAGLELGLRFGLEQAVGVVYTKTLPLYRRIGWVPDVVGTDGEGRESISVGLWRMEEVFQSLISQRSGIPRAAFASWFDASFNAHEPLEMAA